MYKIYKKHVVIVIILLYAHIRGVRWNDRTSIPRPRSTLSTRTKGQRVPCKN